MTPPQPYGMIEVLSVAQGNILQLTKQRGYCNLVGGVMTPPYKHVHNRETKGDFVSSFFHFHALPIWYFSCIIWVLHE